MMTKRPSRSVQAQEATVRDAADLFLDEVYLRAQANQVSWAYYRSSCFRMRRAIEALGPDKPLHMIGKTELAAAVLKIAARPPTQPRPYQKRPAGAPISRVTAKSYIMYLKMLFAWVAEHDDLEWERPKGFARLFRIKDRRLMTPAEQEREARVVVSGEVDTFTTGELTTMFRAGRSLDRLYILLGLNCGFTSGEISALRTFEVYLDEAQPYIHRRRAKTGIEAKWLLWPETARLLRRHKAPTT
jgi:integrase